jgi:hypothetical protein
MLLLEVIGVTEYQETRGKILSPNLPRAASIRLKDLMLLLEVIGLPGYYVTRGRILAGGACHPTSRGLRV